MYHRILWGVLMLLASSWAFAQIGITPAVLDVDLNPKVPHSFRLVNLGDKPKEVEVSVSYWDFDETGRVVGRPPAPFSLVDALVVNPRRFTLPPNNGSQTVRIGFRPSGPLPPGEYRAMVYFTEILPPPKADDTVMRGRFRIGAAVYAQVGKPVRQAVVQKVDADAEGFRIHALNTGTANTRFTARFALIEGPAPSPLPHLSADAPIQGAVVEGEVLTAPFLPGTDHTIYTRFGKLVPAGKYILIIHGALGDDPYHQAFSLIVPKAAQGE